MAAKFRCPRLAILIWQLYRSFSELPILTLLRESYAGFGLHSALAAEKLSKRHFLAETETLRTCRKYPLKGKHLRQNMLTAFDFLSEVEFRFEQIVGKVPLYLLDVETTLQRQAIFCHSASGELLTG